MTNHKGLAILGIASALALGGCAFSRDNATFVTKTSIGLDFDTQPPNLSLAYDRVEGFAGPRFSAGGVPPVAGFIQANGDILNRKVRQVYATGNAARAVTGQTITIVADTLKGEREPMFFGTTTTTGLKVAFDPGVTEITFGHKRKEVSVIPLKTASDDKGTYSYPSVFASVDNGYEIATTPTGTKADVTQFFATGSAAETLAGQGRFIAYFRDLASEAVLKYREQERMQRQTALDILYCLALLPDDKVTNVRANAEHLKLFANQDRLARAKTPADIRAVYTGEIGITDANSKELTDRLVEHQKFVCQLAGK